MSRSCPWKYESQTIDDQRPWLWEFWWLAAVFGGAPAAANRIHPNAREVYSGAVGPYFLRVTTAPIVGNMYFVVHLSKADGVQPVDDAEIAVWGRPDDANLPPVGPVAGVASLDGPNLFTVDLPVDEVGQWVFTMRVRGSLGEDSVDIPLTVSRRGQRKLGRWWAFYWCW